MRELFTNVLNFRVDEARPKLLRYVEHVFSAAVAPLAPVVAVIAAIAASAARIPAAVPVRVRSRRGHRLIR